MTNCLNCKEEHLDTHNFCSSCGTKLPNEKQIEQKASMLSKCPKCEEPYPKWVKNMYKVLIEVMDEKENDEKLINK